jgi:preprotein translocase subunit YajC
MKPNSRASYVQQLPLILLAVAFIGLIMFNRRKAQAKAAAESERKATMQPGSEVMTTSGLYALLISVDAEAGTALVSPAPGVELKWSLAAIRLMDELPPKFRDQPVQPENGTADGVSLKKPDDPDSIGH